MERGERETKRRGKREWKEARRSGREDEGRGIEQRERERMEGGRRKEESKDDGVSTFLTYRP
jgi:hypothetical protein